MLILRLHSTDHNTIKRVRHWLDDGLLEINCANATEAEKLGIKRLKQKSITSTERVFLAVGVTDFTITTS